MDKNEFKTLVKAMKAVYTDPKFIPDNYAFSVWYELLKDIPYDVCNVAIQKYIMTKTFNPTIADIRQLATEIITPERLSEGAAWNLVFKAISNSSYHAEEEFAKLPVDCQKAVGSPAMLREWALMEISEVNTVIQSNFMRSYRVESKRTQEHDALPASTRQKVEQLANRMSVKALEDQEG